jgi:cytochrome c biogenesis protein CcmG, thiol:disulfide interchange protein DsbE
MGFPTLKLGGQVLAVGVVVALLGLLVWKLATDEGSGAAQALEEGKVVAAPDFELPRLDRDGVLRLSSLRGKAVVINFWASWCEPCKEEAPVLEAAWRTYRSRGLVVVGIDAQDFERDARRFMRRYGMTYPVVHDGPGKTLGDFGLTGFPETFFVDRHGRLVGQRVAGAIDRETLDENIELALG